MKIGNGRGSNSFKPLKYFSLKNGEQVYRILPGLGDLADSNRWSMFYSLHYGYKGKDGKTRPFVSPEVRNPKTKEIEVQDVAKERLEMLRNELEKAKKAGNKAATDKLHTLLGYYDVNSKKMVSGVYNIDNEHYMNVIDAQGNIGVLKIKHKAKLALNAEINKLQSEGTYPLSPDDGRYFIFTKNAAGRDTTFSVKVLKEKISLDDATAKNLGLPSGATVERDVVHKLDKEIVARLGAEAAKLDKLFKCPTAEEVKKIVETSDLMTGTSPYMDELFGRKNNEEAVQEESEAEAEVEAEPVAVAIPVAAPAVVSQPTVAVSTASVKVAAQPKNQAQKLEEMDNDEFIRRLSEGTL